MQFVPWQNVADWHCKACGYCCKLYSVVLGFPEWLNISKSFGIETTVTGLDRFYIKRTSDGSCGFLCNKTNTYYCGLQGMKPEACKIWPFKVSRGTKIRRTQPSSIRLHGKQTLRLRRHHVQRLAVWNTNMGFPLHNHKRIHRTRVRHKADPVQNYQSCKLWAEPMGKTTFPMN